MGERGDPQPLAGLRVVELSTFVAAPLGSMTLAQLGADVIRIDPLEGGADHDRWPLAPSGASLYWQGLNKGKRSVTLNLRTQRGRDIATALATAPAEGGGIFVTNAATRPWLSYETLRARRPDLIHVQVQGFPDGRPAIDYTVNAALGFPLVTGPEDGASPVNHVLPAWDVATGLHVAVAVLAAQRERQMTGRGGLVCLSLWNVALAMAGHLGFLSEAELRDADRERNGNYVYGAFGVDFATSDGERVMVVALTARQWNDLVRVTGTDRALVGLAEALNVDFDDAGDRFTYREVLTGLLRPWFTERTLADTMAELGATSVLHAPYRTFRQLVTRARAEVAENPMMSTLHQPGTGPYLAPGSPLRFEAGHPPAARAPWLGEHTGEVLTEVLGLTETDLAELGRDGALGEDEPTRAPGEPGRIRG